MRSNPRSKLDANIENALKRIEQSPLTQLPVRHLQHWNATTKELSFLCQNKTLALRLSQSGCRTVSVIPDCFPKLRPETVRKIVTNSPAQGGKEIYCQIHSFFSRYVRYKDTRTYDLVSVWVMSTYMYMIFTHCGYLYFFSKQMRCGKTRNLELVSILAFNSSPVLTAPTVPTLRETAAEGSTIILDTVDRWKAKNRESYSAAMEFLDAGFKNNSYVSLMDKKLVPNGSTWMRRLVPVYAPYALAGIGRNSLSETARDRAFVIEMQRAIKGDMVKRFHEPEVRDEANAIVDNLYAWALYSARQVAAIYASDSFRNAVRSLGLNDRAEDIWSPLLAIGQTISTDIYECLASLAREMSREDEESGMRKDELSLLNAIADKCTLQGGEWKAMTSEIARLATEHGLQIDETEIRDLLEHIGIEHKNARFPQLEAPRRAWHFSSQQLTMAILDLSP